MSASPLRPVAASPVRGPVNGPGPYLALLLALALLLPPVFMLAPVPIDETRYVAVAWHMHLNGNWLVPFLNGHPYSDKPPLLFWLINAMWWLTGVHAWAARLLAVLATAVSALLVHRLTQSLTGSPRAALAATWVWLGTTAVAAFANAIMFDLLLTVFSLLMWLAAVQADAGRTLRAVMLGGVAAGLGILAKGPVVLLVGGMPWLLAPWWSATARRHALRHYMGLLVVLAIGAGIGLGWALPAAHAGGPAYENALLFRQTLGRVADSFAHERPLWWYLPVLPAMVLPWTLVLARGAGAGEPGALAERRRLRHFTEAAFIPAFVAFCFISGKQPHYLLPLIPALALLLGARLAERRLALSERRGGLLIVLLGVGMVFLSRKVAVHGLDVDSLLWAGAVMVLGAWLALHGRRSSAPAALALAMLATITAAKLAAVASGGLRFDTGPAARYLAQAQRHHVPLLFIGRHNAAFDFAGRLTRPIPQADPGQVPAWVKAHPDGWVLTYVRRFELPVRPLYQQPFLNRELMIWRARDVLAAEASGRATH